MVVQTSSVQGRKVVTNEEMANIFRSALAQAIKDGKSQTQFAREFAALHSLSEASVKQKYNALHKLMKEAYETELAAGRLDGARRMDLALSRLKFADGRKKENGGGTGKGRTKEAATPESLTAWMMSEGLFDKEDLAEALEEGTANVDGSTISAEQAESQTITTEDVGTIENIAPELVESK